MVTVQYNCLLRRKFWIKFQKLKFPPPCCIFLILKVIPITQVWFLSPSVDMEWLHSLYGCVSLVRGPIVKHTERAFLWFFWFGLKLYGLWRILLHFIHFSDCCGIFPSFAELCFKSSNVMFTSCLAVDGVLKRLFSIFVSVLAILYAQ